MHNMLSVDQVLASHAEAILGREQTKDQIPTIWIQKSHLMDVLSALKPHFDMLYDLTAVEERYKKHRLVAIPSDFTVIYHLLSIDKNQDMRIKVPLLGDLPTLPSIVSIWPNANWYEREVYDMFGVRFEGHPFLKRILMPAWWQGYPLQKAHPARATEMGDVWKNIPFEIQQESARFQPEEWGLETHDEQSECMFLNLGPQHPGTHGVLRLVLQMRGEEIINLCPDIGYHHRGAEKMAERQTWHTFIPYTDRIDYLGGVLNNLPYLLAIEQLAQIEIPKRAQVIRVLLCELFRIASHLVWFGTFAQDVGVLSPVFYMFSDRERIFDLVSAATGGRMHPSWFRIGGVAHDLPDGFEKMALELVAYLPKRVDEFEKMVFQNTIFKARTKGVGSYTKKEALEWGVTGPGLRACGVNFDLRKQRAYSSYDAFEFDVPVFHGGDCYDRGLVRIEEMRQSIKIIEQCIRHLPEGPYKSDHPLTTPPLKDKTLVHIETLIHHFLHETWGPVMPVGESFFGVEASKGSNGYYIVSDGETRSYRTRIRTPSFPHLQMLPLLSKGGTIADLMAILGSIDFVLADLDR